jgi:WD40 repeat protein/energy-coupling factor transporter ATP-binding protein EcfA2
MLDPREISNQEEFVAELNRLLARSRMSRRALARELARSGLPAIPAPSTVASWFQGGHLPTPALTSAFGAMLLLLGVDAADDHGAWLDALGRVRVSPGPRPASSPAPYRGLFPYEAEDARFFAGRDALVAQLLLHVRQRSASGDITVVVGPSGSGKTSLLRAGLIPALTQGDPPAPYFTMIPGHSPLGQLTADLSARHDQYQEGSVESPQPLIIVDQFEQLFVACRDRAEQGAFLDALASAAANDTSGPGAMVVLALRSDFYTRALELPVLLEALQRSQLVVGPMSDAELRQAVTEPADRAGVALQPGLIDVILRDLTPLRSRTAKDAAHEAGALPLLSHALFKTWEIARSKTLTIDHYRASGGIEGAVAKTAENAFGALGTPERQDLARGMFLRLIQSSDDQIYTRRRVTWTEILDLGSADEDARQDVLDRFIAARLVTADEDFVEISHEALLSAWPRLTEWVDADQGWQPIHQRLRAAAAQWVEGGRLAEGLYRGGLLQSIQDWAYARGYLRELSRVERQFLDASASQRADEESLARRQTRRRYQLTTLVVVLAVIAASGALIVRQQQAAAARQKQTAAVAQAQALSRLIADKADRLRGSDPALAIQLSLVAYRTAETPEARSSLLNSTSIPVGTRLRAPVGKAKSLALSRAGQIAAGTDKGDVQLWKNTGDSNPLPGRVLKGNGSSMIKVAYSSDGNHLAGADKKGSVLAWDLADPAKPAATLGHLNQEAASIAWSQDGKTVFAASGNLISLLRTDREPTTNPVTITAGLAAIKMIALSPNGRTLAAGSADSNVYIWDIAEPSAPVRLATLTEPNSQIFSVGFSPDSATLAAGTAAEHSIYTWDVHDPVHPQTIGPPLIGPSSWINCVSFSPDGKTLAAASSDSRLWTFDLRSRRSLGTFPHPSPLITTSFTSSNRVVTLATDGVLRAWSLPGPIIGGANDSVFALSFNAAGSKLGIAAGAADNTLSVWSTADSHSPLPQGPPLANPPDTAKLSGSGVVTPDGTKFAAGTVHGDIVIWNISDSEIASMLAPPLHVADDQIEGLAASADGSRIAASADDGTVRIIEVGHGADARVQSSLRAPEAGLIYQAAFSPSGHLVAAASINNDIYLWDVGDRQNPKLLATLSGLNSSALSVAFSPDGTMLAVGAADGTVRLWNVADPNKPSPIGRPLSGPVGYIYGMAFRPNSRVLATGSTDSTVWLWDLTDPNHPDHLATLTGSDQGILAVAFSPTTDLLAAGGHDRAVRLWNTEPTIAAAWICKASGDAITPEEWSQYVPELPFTAPCA